MISAFFFIFSASDKHLLSVFVLNNVLTDNFGKLSCFLQHDFLNSAFAVVLCIHMQVHKNQWQLHSFFLILILCKFLRIFCYRCISCLIIFSSSFIFSFVKYMVLYGNFKDTKSTLFFLFLCSKNGEHYNCLQSFCNHFGTFVF